MINESAIGVCRYTHSSLRDIDGVSFGVFFGDRAAALLLADQRALIEFSIDHISLTASPYL